MDRETARKLLAALRTGNKQALAEYFRYKALEAETVCEHCRHRMRPLPRQFDFDELTVTFECSLCGKRNRVPLEQWKTTPLQLPRIT